jgi:hypothetical protein
LGQQAIGLGDINFTPVPEADVLCGVLGLVAAIGSTAVLGKKRSNLTTDFASFRDLDANLRG